MYGVEERVDMVCMRNNFIRVGIYFIGLSEEEPVRERLSPYFVNVIYDYCHAFNARRTHTKP